MHICNRICSLQKNREKWDEKRDAAGDTDGIRHLINSKRNTQTKIEDAAYPLIEEEEEVLREDEEEIRDLQGWKPKLK